MGIKKKSPCKEVSERGGINKLWMERRSKCSFDHEDCREETVSWGILVGAAAKDETGRARRALGKKGVRENAEGIL